MIFGGGGGARSRTLCSEEEGVRNARERGGKPFRLPHRDALPKKAQPLTKGPRGAEIIGGGDGREIGRKTRTEGDGIFFKRRIICFAGEFREHGVMDGLEQRGERLEMGNYRGGVPRGGVLNMEKWYMKRGKKRNSSKKLQLLGGAYLLNPTISSAQKKKTFEFFFI